MDVRLLFPDHEWTNVRRYSDYNNIIQDLGLRTLFNAASKAILKEDGKIKKVLDSDMFIQDTYLKIMTVPLLKAEEVYYRQDIVKDSLENEDNIIKLYNLTSSVIKQWDKMGRKDMEKRGRTNDAGWLVYRIHTLNLFAAGLDRIREVLEQCSFSSAGMNGLVKSLDEQYFSSRRDTVKRLLAAIEFYISDNSEDDSGKLVSKPHLVMRCRVGSGLKLENMVLDEVSTERVKYRNPNGALTKLRDYMNYITSDAIQPNSDPTLQKQARELEQRCVRYIVSFMEPFYEEIGFFFEQLNFQLAFYRGAINLRHNVERFYLNFCYPRVAGDKKISFTELKEFVMCIEQRINAVGNKCDLSDKGLVIITGANQGGKSTFLRSIGIAQVMLQCGLFVIADEYCGGLYPNLFTHFTRREDASMNSGRLDEELGRMSQIVDNIGPASLVLLNESFATTTELEGSNIAYDIIRALTDAGVRIITVTHLLTFARRVYAECGLSAENSATVSSGNADGLPAGNAATEKPLAQTGINPSEVLFFCAERLENGRRTYKMIQSVPEMTSFGLDLYDEIIGDKY